MARVAAVAMCALLALVVVGPPSVAAQDCDAGKLIVCAAAIIGGAEPSASCCTNLKAQRGCLCKYASNPAYSGYINSPTTRKTLASCGIPIPTCPQ
ncbi:non-specific lipid-transfer protein 2P-like [Triticum aestivum]|uniref:non-specific lipid-transfer protein 2P-like n=1 Tax=Triticum aestivum TaxID=4565 RepID=UPI0003D4BD4E|nr:non-specific lipid-transfer protein 2P-like [Triticum aestivum]